MLAFQYSLFFRRFRGVFALGLGLFVATLGAYAAPRTPLSDTEVLASLPWRRGDAVTRELSQLRATLAQSPTDPHAAAALGQRYFELALARGDPRYLGYAEAVLLAFYATPTADVLLVRGQLRQYRHDFDAALNDFAAALALKPELASTHAWRAAIYLVQMNDVAARQACAALKTLQRSTLWGGCMGLAQAYRGQLASAYAALQQALAGTHDADNRRWLLTRLAEVADWRGQATLAEQHYREALALGQDVYLLAAWADFLRDAGRPAEVVAWLADWGAADGLLLRLAEAEVALKAPLAARHVQALADRFAAAYARGDTTHRAEEARFQLRLRGDAGQALRLASANYQVQREPRDARVLLEAAIAAGDSRAAQVVRDWLRESGFEDGRLRQLGRTSEPLGAAATPKVSPP